MRPRRRETKSRATAHRRPTGSAYENDLLKEIIPFVESHYSVFTDRAHRAIGGMSMGAGQTLNIGLSHLDLFGWITAVAAAPNTKPRGRTDPRSGRAEAVEAVVAGRRATGTL